MYDHNSFIRDYINEMIKVPHHYVILTWFGVERWTDAFTMFPAYYIVDVQISKFTSWVRQWMNFTKRLDQRQCSVNWLWQHRKSICSAFNTKPCQNYIMVQNSTLLHWCCGTRFTLEQAQYCLESHSLIGGWSNPVGALWLPCIV